MEIMISKQSSTGKSKIASPVSCKEKLRERNCTLAAQENSFFLFYMLQQSGGYFFPAPMRLFFDPVIFLISHNSV